MLELKGEILTITLPEGKTQEEIIKIASEQLAPLLEQKAFAGKEVKIDGRCTTALALFLGHKLSHVCKSVSIYDPKTNNFVRAVWH